MKKIRISQDLLGSMLSDLPDSAHQCRDLMAYLALQGEATSGEIRGIMPSANISHLARKINRIIYRRGIVVGCSRPPRFLGLQEISQEHSWAIYEASCE